MCCGRWKINKSLKMMRKLVALAFAVICIALVNAEENCSVADPSKMLRISFRTKRNETGNWVTKFTACGGAKRMEDGMAMDVSQNIVNCGGVEVIKIEGYLASEVDWERTADHRILKGRMAEETYSFKATLYREGRSGKNEVHRFVLPKNASTDFLLLEKKLKTIFQSLQSLPFSVTWQDSEGDEVLISNDEELKIAINEKKGEVYRLKIEVKCASDLKDENAEARMAEETSTFKATLYLEGRSGKNEVHLFVLPKNASTDFLLLEKKLKTVFQSLQSLPFSVTWEDSEGDEVLISNDEELKIAINQMKGEVYRLKIEVKSASDLRDENAEVNKTEEEVVLARKKVVEEESYHRNTQPLHFHERTGQNIELSNNKRTAARNYYEVYLGDGSVITNRPLKDNELFEVQLEKITTIWGNDFSLGVTVANPSTVSFRNHWTFFNNGVWIYYFHSISNNGNINQRGYGINLGTLKVGDRVGVMRKSNGSLHFFVNGADYGAIETKVPETVYGVMDLCGAAVQATIMKP